MTAKEMFEELGYKQETDWLGLVYKKETKHLGTFVRFPTRRIAEKGYYCHGYTIDFAYEEDIAFSINIKLARAITKQLEELENGQ